MQDTIIFIVLVMIIYGAVSYIANSDKKPYLKLEYIDNYQFPPRVKEAVLKVYPHLSSDDANLVIKALKDYFKIALLAKGKMVYMPSHVVDIAWHEFLLFTKEYEKFSNEVFGKFFHHHPTEVMEAKTTQKSIDLTYKNACSLEDIEPKYPIKMPLIFAIDEKLKIENGYKYNLKELSKYRQKGNSSCGGGSCGGGGSDASNYDSSSPADGASCGGGSCGGSCGGG